jgi:uncharacterized repeat protein (TIGR03803 family)
MTRPVCGRRPVFALLVRLLCAATFVLPVFCAHAAVVFTSLYSFTGGADGSGPLAALVQDSDGSFYGTTPYGGTHGGGTVFQMSTNGALTSLYSFPGGNDGAYPWAGLVQGTDGNFYGTTRLDGMNQSGTVFQISTDGTLATLYSFSGDDGRSPMAGLVQGSDGNFYGTTAGGGTNGQGTVFQMSTNGALTSLYSFPGGNNGSYPWAVLAQGSDGNFYGTTALNYLGFGGHRGDGTVFSITTNGVLTTLYSFTGGNDGGWPRAALVQGNDGYFYGTTSDYDGYDQYLGGSGSVFRISTNGSLTPLHAFGSITNATGEALDGAFPAGALVQGSDGNFYGTTSYGGTNGAGTAFKISANGALTTLYAFGSITNASGEALDGANPCAALVQGSDGSFYGTTSGGGTYTNGTVFRLTIVPQPQLTITPSGPNVILTWPTNATGFTLQSTTSLGSSPVWNTNSLAPVVVNGQNTVTKPIFGTQQFYRLSQ